MADLTKTRITAAEYLRDYPQTNTPMELIDGEVIVSPAPFDQHQAIVTELTIELGMVNRKFDLGDLRVSPSDIHFDEHNVVQPDVFLVLKDNPRCRLDDDNYWHGAPDLCIEVLSEGTEKKDKIDKFALYEKYGVREYWLIDPDQRTLQVYVWVNGKFEDRGIFSEHDSVTSSMIPQFTLKLAAVLPRG